ncbi:MAG TPA: alpha/beta hydrolase-fold protein [Gemmataceae bacterium]|nr:alpha/beta hydrolase-fold protein [Gemmataceae bacterium]
MNDLWTNLEISGKPADVLELPPGSPPRFGMLFLHGHGLETLHDRPAFSKVLAELQMTCVCPRGQRSWWGERICRDFDPLISPEQYLLKSVMPFFKDRWGLAPSAVGVFGISMGGQGALRLAFKHPEIFSAVAGISSALDYYDLYGQGSTIDAMYSSKEQCRQDTAIMHIPPVGYPPHIFFCIDPTDTAWFRGNDRLHEKLLALGIPHEIDFTTRAGGHSWEYFNHMAERTIRFVYAGLEKESRRLL